MSTTFYVQKYIKGCIGVTVPCFDKEMKSTKQLGIKLRHLRYIKPLSPISDETDAVVSLRDKKGGVGWGHFSLNFSFIFTNIQNVYSFLFLRGEVVKSIICKRCISINN